MRLSDYEKNRVHDAEGKTKSRRWRERNPDKQRGYRDRWSKRHPEKAKEYAARKYTERKQSEKYKQDKERAREKRRKFREANPLPPRICACGKETPNRNAPDCLECRAAKRKQANRRKSAANYKRRAALGCRGNLLTAEMVGWVYGCFYCGGKDMPLTADHMTPLCKGGAHDMSNIVFACRDCNSKKNGKGFREFMDLINQKVLPAG